MKLNINFEGHEGSEVELDKGLTVIVGDNNSGKSSINRAITWVFLNRPRGDSYLPWSGVAADVQVTDGNTSLRRFRKGNKNEYEIGNRTLKALGSSAPEEVTDLFNITEMNIQEQKNPYYILMESSGAVARMINQIAGMSEADEAIKCVNEMIDKAKSADAAYRKTEMERLEAAGGLAWAVPARDMVMNISSTGKELRELESDIELAQQTVVKLQEAVDYSGKFDCLESFEEDIRYLYERTNHIVNMTEDILDAENVIEGLRMADVSKFRHVEDMERSIASISAAEQAVAKNASTAESIENILDKVSELNKDFSIIEDAEVLLNVITAPHEVIVPTMEEIIARSMSISRDLSNIEETISDLETKIASVKICSECGRPL